MNALLKPTGHELVVTRGIRASRERVFAAWTDPRQAAQWWAPQDCTPLTCEMDLRPGGTWRRTMPIPDGSVIAKHGVFREVGPPELLSFTYTTEHADGAVDEITVVTVTLDELPGGWTGALERFAGFLDFSDIRQGRVQWTFRPICRSKAAPRRRSTSTRARWVPGST